MEMHKSGILVCILFVFLGFGCLTEEEADEIELYIHDVEENNDTNSVELTVNVMYKGYDDMEGTTLVSYLKEKRYNQWYAEGSKDEIVVGKIDNGFNEMYYPTFSNLDSGEYRVVIQIVYQNNETRGEVISSTFTIS